MSLVLWYLDSNFLVKESFVGFIHCNTGLTGEHLSNTILKEIESLELSMDDCRGKGFDGAGAMTGSEKGVASRISQRYPNAIYSHCYSHILKLCVMKCIKIEQVKSMFEYCRTISDFFNNSLKRVQLFENVLQNLRHKKTQKLINFCKTRWVERINGLSVFLNCYVVTCKCLKKISNNKPFDGSTWNAES